MYNPAMDILFATGCIGFAFFSGLGIWRDLEKGPGAQAGSSTALSASASVLVFGLFDLGWLLMLPAAGLSFGAFSLPAFVFLLTRLAVLCLAMLSLKIGSLLWPLLPSPSNLRRAVTAVWGANFVLATLLVYGSAVEPFQVQVSRIPIHGPAFFADRALKVLQISDLHVERLTSREAQVLELVTQIQPDIIVLTGDYVNIDFSRDSLTWAQTRQWASRLKAPYGVYAIQGSWGVDSSESNQAIFGGLDVTLLTNETRVLHFPGGELNLVGLELLHANSPVQAEILLNQTLQPLKPENFTILLYHTPDLALSAAKTNVDLYLGGHTHGGQICLPFYGAIVTNSAFHKRFESGRYRVEDMTIYISRGLGMEGFGMPRIRFLAPPEIAVFEIGP